MDCVLLLNRGGRGRPPGGLPGASDSRICRKVGSYQAGSACRHVGLETENQSSLGPREEWDEGWEGKRS